MRLGPRTRSHPQEVSGYTPGRRRGHSEHRVKSCLCTLIPSRDVNPSLPFCVSFSSDCRSPYQPVSQGNWLVNSLQTFSPCGAPGRCRVTRPAPRTRPCSRPFYRRFYPCRDPCHASVVTLPVNKALHRPPPSHRRSRDRPVSSYGRAPGTPAPCGGCASWPTARLDNAFWPLHRRGLGAPGPAQGEPLWRHAPRWTRLQSWGWSRLAPSAYVDAQFPAFLGRVVPHFLDAFSRAGTAQ